MHEINLYYHDYGDFLICLYMYNSICLMQPVQISATFIILCTNMNSVNI